MTLRMIFLNHSIHSTSLSSSDLSLIVALVQWKRRASQSELAHLQKAAGLREAGASQTEYQLGAQACGK